MELDAVIKEKGTHGGQSRPGDDDSMANAMPPEFLHPSGTELAREFTHMISTQRAFDANAKTITTADEMLGSLLNIKA